MSDAKGTCPTGKRPYYKERLANRAVTEAAKRGELGPLRHYKCDQCDWWHLSRKDRFAADESDSAAAPRTQHDRKETGDAR